MITTFLRGALVATSLVCCVGCMDSDCPPPMPSGTYQSSGNPTVDEPTFPHGAETKIMTLRRELHSVEITYQREGQQIVEHYRIVDSSP